MKFLIVFALATASAFDLRGAELKSHTVGVPVVKNEDRITNGNIASENQFPYQVGIALNRTALNTYWCGGSLIGKEWVLTAAHCLDDIKHITVYLGDTVHMNANVSYNVSMDNVTIHHDYDAKNVTNDIALIRIPVVSLSSKLQIVRLPAIASSYPTYSDEYVIVSGWGWEYDTSTSFASNLKWGRMKVNSGLPCELFVPLNIASELCVSPIGTTSTCDGDSGGPLVLESNKTLIGLVSFGTANDCEKGYPIIFTRITYYLDWIQSITGIAY